MTVPHRLGTRTRESLRAQTPAMLIAAAAVAAILFVNQAPSSRAEALRQVPVPASAPGLCADCGVVVAIQPGTGYDHERRGHVRSYEVSVLMNDGSVRTYRESAPMFAVGHRVRITGHGIAPRV